MKGGALSVMVITIENGNGNPSWNCGWVCVSLFTNAFWKGMNLSAIPTAMSK